VHPREVEPTWRGPIVDDTEGRTESTKGGCCSSSTSYNAMLVRGVRPANRQGWLLSVPKCRCATSVRRVGWRREGWGWEDFRRALVALLPCDCLEHAKAWPVVADAGQKWW
jgi:hypothetical protein